MVSSKGEVTFRLTSMTLERLTGIGIPKEEKRRRGKEEIVFQKRKRGEEEKRKFWNQGNFCIFLEHDSLFKQCAVSPFRAISSEPIF